jgi:hypothetical protein
MRFFLSGIIVSAGSTSEIILELCSSIAEEKLFCC